jgi:predicted deacetylase
MRECLKNGGLYTSKKSATVLDEKQARVAAAEAKKMLLETGACRKLNCASVGEGFTRISESCSAHCR